MGTSERVSVAIFRHKPAVSLVVSGLPKQVGYSLVHR